MKHLIVLLSVFPFLSAGYSQTGVNCSNPHQTTTLSSINYELYEFPKDSSSCWIELSSSSNTGIYISLNPSIDSLQTSIQGIRIYKKDSDCNSLILLGSKNLLTDSDLDYWISSTQVGEVFEIEYYRNAPSLPETNQTYFEAAMKAQAGGLCWYTSSGSSGLCYPYGPNGWPGTMGNGEPCQIEICEGDEVCLNGFNDGALNSLGIDCNDLANSVTNNAVDFYWWLPGSDDAVASGNNNIANNSATGIDYTCHTFSSAGTYDVQFNSIPYTSQPGFTNNLYYQIVVTQNISGDASFTLTSGSICEGEDVNIQFSGSSSTTNNVYVDGVLYGSISSFNNNYTFTNAGTYDITVEAVAPVGCGTSDTQIQQIEVLPALDWEVTMECDQLTIVNNGCGVYGGGQFAFSWEFFNSQGLLVDNVSTPTADLNYVFTTSEPYTVVVTFDNGNQTETFNVFPHIPSYNLGIHGDLNVCCATGLIYDASPGYLSYDWSITGGTIVNTFGNNVEVDWDQPFTGGSLSVETVDQFGCVSTGTINVSPCDQTPAPAPVIEGPDMKCCTQGAIYTINGNYSNFNWIVPDGVIVTNNGNAITVDWNSQANNTTITVTMLDENCQEISSTLLVEECCKVTLGGNGPQVYDTYINTDYCQPTYISSIIPTLPNGSTYTSGNAILINHDLIIDQDFTFSACPFIYVMEGHKIYVEPGIRFTLENDCVIRPTCDDPWQGIIADDPNASVKILNSNIVGAEVALFVSNNAQYDVDNGGFLNNQIGIKVENFLNPTFNSVDNGSFFGPEPSEPNVFGVRPTHGMLIENVANITIGEDNDFVDMDFGIYVNNSNVTCLKNHFNDFNTIQGGFNDGVAVYGITDKKSPGNTLIVGDSYVNRNFFNNCHVGVFVTNKMSLIARYNVLYDMKFVGIASRKSSSVFMDINRNNIRLASGFTVGIYMQGMLNVLADVQHNKVNLMSLNNANVYVAGIAFDQVSVGTLNTINCSNNTIRQCNFGIYANLTQGIEIKQNGIQYFNYSNTSNNIYGIYATGCTDANIESNTVTRLVGNPSNNNPNVNLVGIHAENSPQVSIYNNKINKFGKGIQAKGNNGNSEMYCNRMLKTYNGVYLNNADVGDQGNPSTNQDNKWLQNVSDRITGNATSSVEWFYRNGNAYNVYPNSLGGQPQTYTLNNSAQSICPQPGFPRPPVIVLPRSQQRQQLFDPIVYDQKNYQTYDTTLKYLDKIYAMTSFDEDTTWLTVGDTSDVSYHQYFLQEDAGNLGKICEISKAYKSEDYTTVDAKNNALSTGTCRYAKGLQDVNTIYLDTWANEEFEYTPAQLARLEELACSDALENGAAVYTARTLLGWGYPCANGYEKSSSSSNEEEENMNIINHETSFLVYPNPSEGEIYLAYELGDYQEALLTVYDLSGKLMMSVQLSSETLAIQLPTENLNSGMYIYTVTTEGKSLANGKFVMK